ncbi:MAG TPA: hypothetical protein VGK73_36455 [Polyangiaceae bacterium]
MRRFAMYRIGPMSEGGKYIPREERKRELIGFGVEWIEFGSCSTTEDSGSTTLHWRTITDIAGDIGFSGYEQTYEYIDSEHRCEPEEQRRS